MSTDTRDTILQTARRLFIKQGYTASSMRQIAEEAGIGKATIYHHFADKETILMTLVNGVTGQMHTTLKVVQAESEPRRRIQVMAEVSIRSLYEAADILQIARREVPEARRQVLDSFQSTFQQYLTLLEEAFNTGMRTGIFRPIDPHETALVFMTLVQGNFAMFYVTGRRAETPELAAARMLDVFFNGINAHPTQQT